MFSPDGRWIAYQSTETGRHEVYVRPYPGPGSKEQISTDGGVFPTWSRTARELFFGTPTEQIMVSAYEVKATRSAPRSRGSGPTGVTGPADHSARSTCTRTASDSRSRLQPLRPRARGKITSR
jgi:hypothetical protein